MGKINKDFLNNVRKLTNAKNRLISRPIEYKLLKYAYGGGRKETIDKYYNITKELVSNNVKVKTWKALIDYTAPMVYLQIQIFREGDPKQVREEERAHSKNKKVILPPHDYIILTNSGFPKYYFGDQNFEGQTQQYRNILMNKSEFEKLKRKQCLVYKGHMTTMKSYFVRNEKFIEAIKNEEIRDEFTYIADYGALFVLQGVKNAIKLNKEYLKPEYIEVMKAINEKRMINKYLNYEINPLATTLEGLFKPSKYFESNCCFPNAMMINWADRFNKVYKKKKLSYAFIWKICKNEEYKEGQEMPMTFKEACNLFKFIRQECKVYDDSFIPKLLSHYHPSQDGLKIDDNLGGRGVPLIVIYKDGHVFPVVDSNLKRSITLTEFKQEELTPPSDVFKQMNINTQPMGCIHDINDAIYKAIPFIKSSIDEDEPIKLEFILNNPKQNLKDIYLHLLNNNYVPMIRFNKYLQIERLTLKINNCIISIVVLNISSDTIATDDLVSMTNEEAERFQQLNQLMNNKLTNSKYRSDYSDNFKDVLKYFKRCPETLIFEE
jgi:hypothetical protein